jgi:hypothetical protein
MIDDAARMTTEPVVGPHCAYCGHRIEDDTAVIERFGERFCSEGHGEQFTQGVRAARIQAAARQQEAAGREPQTPTACGLPPAERRTWQDTLKRGACWGAPLLLLLALPLFWSGSTLGAAGGSLLSVLAALACPLGMYFMMRAMGGMQHGGSREEEASRERQTPRSPREEEH